MTYEIEHVRHELHYVAMVSMLTGLPLDELRARLPERLWKTDGWYGRDFAETFRSLGYNCAPDFAPSSTRPRATPACCATAPPK